MHIDCDDQTIEGDVHRIDAASTATRCTGVPSATCRACIIVYGNLPVTDPPLSAAELDYFSHAWESNQGGKAL
ncbi:MAG: hypothetical protein AMJ69_05940 [Gammaproteobacteria bacterium SG8_47]|nr:MAG: hypothetical protein AMJ69_05940 [Gammaproteobacteria bacterium SG8_47]